MCICTYIHCMYHGSCLASVYLVYGICLFMQVYLYNCLHILQYIHMYSHTLVLDLGGFNLARYMYVIYIVHATSAVHDI